jgi:hypothetical protein
MYPCCKGVQLTRALGRSAWGVSLPRVLRARKPSAMAEQTFAFLFDDIPLAEARWMDCGLHTDPQLSPPLRTRLQSLSDHAGRLTVSDSTRPTTMKNRILRVATELGIPVTVRRVSGGLFFWCPTDNDVQQAKAVACKRRTARRGRHARQGARRRASHGTPITGCDAEGDEQLIHLSRYRTAHPTPRQPLLCDVLSILHIVWQF